MVSTATVGEATTAGSRGGLKGGRGGRGEGLHGNKARKSRTRPRLAVDPACTVLHRAVHLNSFVR